MASESSSAKKVARAARAGGRVSSGSSRDYTFPAVLGVVCLLGALLVTYARSERVAVAQEAPRIGQDHWHAAYGIYICGEWQAPLSDTKGDRVGIHTHDDGLIHIHPFSSLGAGDDAQTGDFFEEMSIEIQDDDTKLVLPDGREFTNGDECDATGDIEAGPGELQLVRWNRVITDGDEDGQVITTDLDSQRFRGDGEGWVLAFIADGTEVPKPLSTGALPNVSDIIDPNAETTDPADGITVETDNGDVTVVTGDVDSGEPSSDDDSSDGDDAVTTTTAG